MVALEKMLDPAVVWHAQRVGALGGDRVGWDALARFFWQTMEMTEGSFHTDVVAILGNGRRAPARVEAEPGAGRRRRSRHTRHRRVGRDASEEPARDRDQG